MREERRAIPPQVPSSLDYFVAANVLAAALALQLLLSVRQLATTQRDK